MGTEKHLYFKNAGGRSIQPALERGGGMLARLTCRCGLTEAVKYRSVPEPSVIDKKFTQRGWAVDPAECPGCRSSKKEKAPVSEPSPTAIRAQAQAFNLLSTHFDAEAGNYSAGWSDEKIAADTGLALNIVKAFRKEAFGEIKVPQELAALQNDVEALETLVRETKSSLDSELTAVKTRLARAISKFSA